MTNALLVHTPRIGYEDAWARQRELASLRTRDRVPDVVWLLEHDPVFTMGRHGTRTDLFLSDDLLAARGATFVQADRGGQMTWHGPGQTTGYVILRLDQGLGVREFVLALLSSMAAASGIAGAVVDGDAMGVYVGGRKLGSVGIRVKDRVTYHGLALNRDPDLEWFTLMTACGAPGVEATSIAREGGDPDRARVEARLADELAARLDLTLTPGPLPGAG